MLKKLKKQLKKLIEKNDRLYVLARCMRSINDPELSKLLKGYYENDSDVLSVFIMNSKSLADTKDLIYMIQFGCNDICTMGFGSLLRFTLIHIAFAELIQCEPFVIWGKWTHYYEEELEQYSTNAFTYYFKPVSSNTVQMDKSYVQMDNRHATFLHESDNYRVNEADVDYYAGLYKKYIELNEEVKTYIAQQLKKIFTGERVLGVHARGTDFNISFRGHPRAIPSNIYTDKAKDLFQNGNYDKVFVATDDTGLLTSFMDVFGDKLVYYDDVMRASGSKGPHNIICERQFHHFKLGLEVLRDIYTLAYCDGLVCGMSQTSFAARYISRALGNKYDRFVLIDNGINRTGKEAKATRKIS